MKIPSFSFDNKPFSKHSLRQEVLLLSILFEVIRDFVLGTGLTDEEFLILQMGPMTEWEARHGSEDDEEVDRQLQRWGEERYQQILRKVQKGREERESCWLL